jgi:hypothetical protein
MRFGRLGRGFLVVLFAFATAARAQTVNCSSDDGGKRYCDADTRHGAHLVRQSSTSPCTEGATWGYDEQGIWVDKGCGGEFALGSKEEAGETGATAGVAQKVTCSSDDGKRRYCPAETRGGVQLVLQRGQTICSQGSNWGYDNHGIWVNRGCGGDFVVGVPGHPAAPARPVETKNQVVNCSSDDGRRNFCGLNVKHAKVRLIRPTGGEPCMEGTTWGYDGSDIWVDHGCRGDFRVQTGSNLDDPDSEKESCKSEAGKEKAKELVQQCLQVSPGTHPPCSEKNSCQMLRSEIQRRCGFMGPDAPSFCSEYSK